MSRSVRKRTFGHENRTKIQISVRMREIWSESSFAAFWIDKNAKFLHVDNEDSDQIARMRKLIWVIVGRTCPKVCFLTLRTI